MPKFSNRSLAALKELHPDLQRVASAAIKKIDFVLLDAQRGRVEQEKAFRAGNSKARFGQSAHNYTPAIAFDLCPYPINWKWQQFVTISKIILPIAASMSIPLRWGGDWNMNGSYTDEHFLDWGHYELLPSGMTIAKARAMSIPNRAKLLGAKPLED